MSKTTIRPPLALGRKTQESMTEIILIASGLLFVSWFLFGFYQAVENPTLTANALHQNSPRQSAPFIKINCAVLTRELVESEPFGHKKAAFTGATTTGDVKFSAADGGTLLPDEIGDMSPETQGKILRILQEKEFERAGGNHTIRVDVRILAATNKDLPAMVQTRTFREDLF